MTREAIQMRRLGRLIALAGAEQRQSAMALAAALRTAESSRRQQHRVETLIAGMADAQGPENPAILTARAQLRLLLQPANEAAAGSAARAADARRAAEARLAEARAREMRLQELLADARLARSRLRDRRQSDATPCRPRQ